MSGMVDELNADRQRSALLHRARQAGRCDRTDRRRVAAPNRRARSIAWVVSIADHVSDPGARDKDRDADHKTPAQRATERATFRRRCATHLDDFPVVRCRRPAGPWRVVGTHTLKSSFAEVWIRSDGVPSPPRRSHGCQNLEHAFERVEAATTDRRLSSISDSCWRSREPPAGARRKFVSHRSDGGVGC
jgi:hypothetical protein